MATVLGFLQASKLQGTADATDVDSPLPLSHSASASTLQVALVQGTRVSGSADGPEATQNGSENPEVGFLFEGVMRLIMDSFLRISILTNFEDCVHVPCLVQLIWFTMEVLHLSGGGERHH